MAGRSIVHRTVCCIRRVRSRLKRRSVSGLRNCRRSLRDRGSVAPRVENHVRRVRARASQRAAAPNGRPSNLLTCQCCRGQSRRWEDNLGLPNVIARRQGYVVLDTLRVLAKGPKASRAGTPSPRRRRQGPEPPLIDTSTRFTVIPTEAEGSGAAIPESLPPSPPRCETNALDRPGICSCERGVDRPHTPDPSAASCLRQGLRSG